MGLAEKIHSLPKEEIRRLALKGEIILASAEGIKILHQQIIKAQEEMVTTQAAIGQVAKDDGDLPENLQFKELRVKAMFQLPRAIQSLRIMEAKTVEFQENNGETVIFGSQVDLAINYPDGETEEGRFSLLGPIEASYMTINKTGVKVISYQSPVGQSIWGAKPGSTVEYKIPDGEVRCVIKSVE